MIDMVHQLSSEGNVNSAKRQQIGTLAEEVRRALKLTPPLSIQDLKRAIARLNGEVVSADKQDAEASIKKDGLRFQIALDETKPPKRQLFSLAHELGHLFVHMGFGDQERWSKTVDYVESYARSGYDEEEFAANEFAAALLMPEADFAAVAKSGLPVAEVAEKFGVSADAALIRGRWLNIYPWT